RQIREIRIRAQINVDALEERIVQVHGFGEIAPFQRFAVRAVQRCDIGQGAARPDVRLNYHSLAVGAAEGRDLVDRNIAPEVVYPIWNLFLVGGKVGNFAHDHALDRVVQRLFPPVANRTDYFLIGDSSGVDVDSAGLGRVELLTYLFTVFV